ncbi:MAG: 2-succinylbenzoyl-CoA synthetase [Acidobacteria bacterium]|nr:MAG: 2-succinylbenzoyl-CoA synthetase [Acidobacteriota bacterium]REJ99376.1 MAG: 2-succinylbenzoyl-CoA synthetase [Acidobacteriota bacterium]
MKNNIGLFLTKRAHLSPDQEGFVDLDTGRRFTYRQWNERSNRTANLLLESGVSRGDRVALLMMNSIEYMESFFALAKIGAVCVPLNWRLTVDELAFIVRDAECSTLLFGGEFGDAVAKLAARGDGENGTSVQRWIHVGATADEAPPDFAQSYVSLQKAASADEPEISACDDDLLYIMYTSGTTGLPKGAVHTHSTALWGLITIAATADSRPSDRYLVALPLFHVGALTPCTSIVHLGATALVMRQFDPRRAWQVISDEKITTGLKVPAMLNFMLQVYDPSKIDHSSLRWLQSGAAPVPVSLIHKYAELGIEVQQVYGLTETCGPACLISSADAIARAGSTGKAFFHTDVRVVDEDGNDCEPGGYGEVVVRGGHIMKEYWKRPEATQECIRDGWFHTGDGASMDADGFVYIQDRIKDMYISGGENVYPAEVENVLASHPDIVEAGVIGVPSEKWGESGAAVVVRKRADLSEEEVLDFCRDKLARYKQPKLVYFTEQIPRNPSGKILKRVLREQFPGAAPE